MMACLELFLTFFKIGAFTFGGGYAMLPLIEQEVLAHEAQWNMSLNDMINFVAVSESTPGPFAVNMATYIGSEVAGVWGSFFATLGVVMPSFIIILIVAKCYLAFKNSRVVKGCMSGLRPVAVGLIGAAVLTIALTVFFPSGAVTLSVVKTLSFWCSLALCGVGLVMAFKKVHPIFIILLSAGAGIGLGYLGVFA